MNTRTLVLFQNTRSVIKAERICIEANIKCKVIPVPREISSECGMAIEIDPTSLEIVKEMWHQKELNFSVKII